MVPTVREGAAQILNYVGPVLQSAGASPMVDGKVDLVNNKALKKAIEIDRLSSIFLFCKLCNIYFQDVIVNNTGATRPDGFTGNSKVANRIVGILV